jgi:hypothetical protein
LFNRDISFSDGVRRFTAETTSACFGSSRKRNKMRKCKTIPPPKSEPFP